ncbi:unknown [Clostridium sp. CAG:780]|nr:unknown [Clostridium sp. CAG:780]
MDKNGIIQKSKDARKEYGQAKANEQEDLSNLSDMIEEATAEPTPKVDVNTKAGDNSTINGKKGNSNNPTIPKNYIPIDTATSTWGDGSTAPSQDSVNHGLVIKDEKNNEWVWIPVDKTTLATMYEESSDEKTLCGTTGETAVKTKLYSKSEIISGQTRVTPGTTTDVREPDLVVKKYDGKDDYDSKEEYYKTILEFESKEKMAEAFVADYNEMIASISKYGGFYIGRYELSEAGVQKDKATLTNTNWYNLYKKCKELNASEKVETRMIWGCQWDTTMNWLISSGAKTSDEVNKDSSSWGNYKGTSVKADDGTTKIKESGTREKELANKFRSKDK